ncbi:MAG: ComEC/Rec2 family competence protein [Chloroflexaceae bacterium]|nr:ComEC/Rec2 family competence protein [Chloroflexaceae bacterium]
MTAWLPLAIAFLGLGVVAGLSVPRMWRFGPRRHQWLVAGLIAGLGIVYLQIRLPQPASQDISQLLAQGDASPATVTVTGKILEPPRLTRQRKVQFWLQATAVSQGETLEQAVTGKVYATVPLLQGTGLYPGQLVAVTGRLYQPRAALNPGAFDFRTYLAAKGTFTGLAGKQVIALAKPPRWGLWRWRQRIVRAQVKPLGSPAGPLLSSIVLGRQAVDLPHDIRDLFIKAGLAHVLAASGFHVSLLLGAILTLTKGLGRRTQLILGVIALVFYVGLTGIQPSVLRAALMGGAALLAIAWEQKIRPVGLLLVVAVGLLLVNPLWIFDLGFALSFLATLGLLVTLPPLLKVFEGSPPVFATAIAVPLAASLWTLPLLIYLYNTVVTYSLIANVVSTIPITVISLGGMASAFAALLWPPAGSAIAFYWPIRCSG